MLLDESGTGGALTGSRTNTSFFDGSLTSAGTEGWGRRKSVTSEGCTPIESALVPGCSALRRADLSTYWVDAPKSVDVEGPDDKDLPCFPSRLRLRLVRARL
jgi:hypothetical protein